MKFTAVPNTFVLIFSFIVLMAALTWILPGGEFSRRQVEGRTVLVPGSFRQVPHRPQNVDAVLMAPFKGFVQTAHIIAFILFVGGAFAVVQASGALNALVGSIVRAHERSRTVRLLLIPLLMALFSLFGSVFGMSEEVIPFVLIFIPMAISLGYDSIVGVAIPFVGAGVGFASAFLNPFTVGIAQGIAELPTFSGIGYRILLWVIFTGVAVAFVLRYAARVKRSPERSPVYELDDYWRQKTPGTGQVEAMRPTHRWVLALFLLAVAALIYGVLRWHWYIAEIAALFFALGIAAGLIGGLSVNKLASVFVDGARDLAGAALIVGFARGILVVAEDGKIVDTILHALSGLVRSAHPVFAGQLMFVVQSCINFFVPSGSGQAALTMPIMAPLSDLVGVTRQTAVLAFQFGDGFSNMIIPTSAVTMGVLGLARIPWERWAHWIFPLEVIFFLLAALLLIPPVVLDWGPF